MNTDMDENDSEKEENPGIPRFLFSGTATQGSDSIQRMDKLRKLLKEALSVASALANAPSSSIHWDQTITWLTECLFQIVNTDFHETQKARHNEIIKTMAKLIADVELLKNTNLHSHKQTICKVAKLQAGIKPTALCSAIDKENSIESSLDFLYYLYNYYMVCVLLSYAYHVTHHVMSCDVML